MNYFCSMKTKTLLPFFTALMLSSAIAFGQSTAGADCAAHPNPLIASPAKLDFTPKNISKTIVVNIQNPTNAPLQLGTLLIDGPDKNKFALLHKDAVAGKKASAQPKENCSNAVISPHGSCSIRVQQLSSKPADLQASIHIPVGKCDVVVLVREERK
jgi:hypothetical protein